MYWEANHGVIDGVLNQRMLIVFTEDVRELAIETFGIIIIHYLHALSQYTYTGW